ncbi:hypothetical protein Pan97_04500 [Bremerella volcania]|uniref:Uncharacterized protein n=1 Tax=Bremerella volcania TaxID=2527984 RepID=A0A518C2N2_9BACT|nr:hypothetical protein Pan97_04500 [Bremerella volcania]
MGFPSTPSHHAVAWRQRIQASLSCIPWVVGVIGAQTAQFDTRPGVNPFSRGNAYRRLVKFSKANQMDVTFLGQISAKMTLAAHFS